MGTSWSVALATTVRYEPAVARDWQHDLILRDDALLTSALAAIDGVAVRVDWRRRDVDWARFNGVVIRSTWDYAESPDEFRDWLGVVATRSVLCNDLNAVRWNLDKHYLLDLQDRGVSIVASRFVDRGGSLPGLLAEVGWDDAVVKPCVGSSGRHTYRVRRAESEAFQDTFDRLVQAEPVIVQCFQRSVLSVGEYSFVFLGGRYSHSVRKIARPGEFRVQDDFGGHVFDFDPDPALLAFAERAIAAGPATTYARVDVVWDNDGRPTLMELSLVEPDLWLYRAGAAPAEFASAVRGAVLR